MWRFDAVDMPFLTYLLFNLELLLGLLISLIVFATCQWKRSAYEDILSQMVDILVEFKHLNQELDLRLLRRLFNKLLLGVGIFLSTIVTVDAIYHNHFYKSACGAGAYFIPHAVQIITSLQYVYVLIFAYRKCKSMNKSILSLRFVLKTDLISYTTTLEKMRKQHMELHRLVFKMNKYFGVFNICSIVLVLTATSTTCLEVYQTIQRKDSGLYLTYSGLWIVLHCSKLVFILYPNYLMENERDLTGIILHGLPQCEHQQYKIEVTDYSDRVYCFWQVMAFSRQVIHQKGSYTACGIVDLNLSVIASIFGALATFLIILIE
ncbi:uncharacterized protein LOC131688088, partial [Topomyia yanbarensis]|uniref:uncharacterized protein LOC131688088 n=1 Tax=Topomyia yanbarensis TaxID=2498891 RepID=UPI00273C15E4